MSNQEQMEALIEEKWLNKDNTTKNKYSLTKHLFDKIEVTEIRNFAAKMVIYEPCYYSIADILLQTKGKSFFFDKQEELSIESYNLSKFSQSLCKKELEERTKYAFEMIQHYANETGRDIYSVIKRFINALFTDEEKIKVFFGDKKVFIAYRPEEWKQITITEAKKMSGCLFGSLEEAKKNKEEE